MAATSVHQGPAALMTVSQSIEHERVSTPWIRPVAADRRTLTSGSCSVTRRGARAGALK